MDEQIQMQTNELCNHQLDSKGNNEITNFEDIVCNDTDNNFENKVNNSVYVSNDLKDEGVIKSSLLNMKCSFERRDCDEPKVNIKVENYVENDQLYSHLTELKNNNEVQNFQNVSHKLDHNYTNEIHNLHLNNVFKDINEIDSSLLTIKHDRNESKVKTEVQNNMQSDQLNSSSTELKENCKFKNFQSTNNHIADHNYKNKIHNSVYSDNIETESPLLNNKYESNESKVNTEVKNHVLNKQLHSDLTEFKESYKLNNHETVVCKNVDNNLKNEGYNTVYLANNVNIENSSSSSLIRGCNKPKINIKVEINDLINNLSSSQQFKNEFSTLGLNFELLNGIHQYGFQRLMTLQQQCISYCIDGRDIVLHSYPCAGKSTMCFISVLQRINTSINECQAIILVPTLELALFSQKVLI